MINSTQPQHLLVLDYGYWDSNNVVCENHSKSKHNYAMTFLTYVPVSIRNIQTPGVPTLVVWSILIIPPVSDRGMVTNPKPSPALIPARAFVPNNPLDPPDLLPVVHSILPSAYKNIANDWTPLVASMHWNVLVYRKNTALTKLHCLFDIALSKKTIQTKVVAYCTSADTVL